MNKATINSLVLSIVVLLISTIGGALIAQKIAEGDAGFSFLWFGSAIACLIFLLQLLAFSKARAKLFHQLLFLGFFGFSMVWFMLSLFLPIFWIETISTQVKSILFFVFSTIMSFNIKLGWETLNKKWDETGDSAFKSEFRAGPNSGDWNKVVRELKITHNIYIPGVSEKWTSALSVVLIVFMIVGLNLRTAYPAFSAFAWGIPAIIMGSYFIQVSGFYFAQASQVRKLENRMGIVLKSTI